MLLDAAFACLCALCTSSETNMTFGHVMPYLSYEGTFSTSDVHLVHLRAEVFSYLLVCLVPYAININILQLYNKSCVPVRACEGVCSV